MHFFPSSSISLPKYILWQTLLNTMPLCNTCQGIAPSAWALLSNTARWFYPQEDPLKPSRTYSHYSSFVLLQKSSQSCELCLHRLHGFEIPKNIPEILEYAASGKPTQIYLVNSGSYDLGGQRNALFHVRCSELLPMPNLNGAKCWNGNEVLIYFSPGKALSHEFPCTSCVVSDHVSEWH
jgi:hypothetical protein